MMICQVVGHVWATKKEEKLNGHKLMIVREETTTTRKGATFVAADSVGARDRRDGPCCQRKYSETGDRRG